MDGLRWVTTTHARDGRTKCDDDPGDAKSDDGNTDDTIRTRWRRR